MMNFKFALIALFYIQNFNALVTVSCAQDGINDNHIGQTFQRSDKLEDRKETKNKNVCNEDGSETTNIPMSNMEEIFARLDIKGDDWVNPNDMFNFNPVTADYKRDLVSKETSSSTLGVETKSTSSDRSNQAHYKSTFKHYSPNEDKPADIEMPAKDSYKNQIISSSRSDLDDVNKQTKIANACNRLEFAYLVRLLQMLLHKVEIINERQSIYIAFTTSDLETINAFVNMPCKYGNDVEVILSRVISESLVFQEDVNMINQMMRFMHNNVWLTFACITFTFIFCFWLYLRYCVISLWRIMWYLLFLATCMSFASHWINLYQNKVAERLANFANKDILSACHKEQSFWQHFYFSLTSYFSFTKDDCLEFYKSIHVNPIWEVSALMALSETISQFILQPLDATAHHLHKFVKNLFSGLPLVTSIFLALFLLLFVFLIMIMICRYRLKFPFFLGVLEPSSKSSDVNLMQSKTPCKSNFLSYNRIQDLDHPETWHENIVADAQKEENISDKRKKVDSFSQTDFTFIVMNK